MSPVIQTEVTPELHRRVSDEARRRKLSLRALIQEAVEDAVGRAIPYGGDPLDDLIGSMETKEGDWSTRKDWRA